MPNKLPLNDFEKSLPHHKMILVEGGEFLMGGRDENAFERETPLHLVRVPPFYMAQYPVTQALWKAMMDGQNPALFKGDHRPVENVSWDDAQKFIKKLNQQTGRVYRLPSESEWEYAARGGKHSENYLYAGSDKLSEVGWYNKNSGSETQDVGQLLSNELGIHDLSGNVWEWCEDNWFKTYRGAPIDGSAWISQGKKDVYCMFRGSSWGNDSNESCISRRHTAAPEYKFSNIGFRLTLSPRQLGCH